MIKGIELVSSVSSLAKILANNSWLVVLTFFPLVFGLFEEAYQRRFRK